MNYSSFLEEDGFVIFLFHGVIKSHRYEVRNYTRKHILSDDFVHILDELCSNGMPVSMASIANGEALPPKAFAVTFDDGFENNYSVAAPILNARALPATFYVTTGFIDSQSGSWIDMIEYGIENTKQCLLDLPFLKTRKAKSKKDKIKILDEIRAAVKTSNDIDPYALVKTVWGQLGIETFVPDSELDRKMTWGQISELSRNPSFTIGGHGKTHKILSFLDPASLHDEITESLKTLRGNLDVPIEHYSYPEGLSHCYSDDVIALLRENGVSCAPTAEPGVNHIGDDLFHLKRILIS